MSTTPAVAELSGSRHRSDRIGDWVLYGLTVLASLAAVVVILAIIYKVVSSSRLAVAHFGVGFVTNTTWNPVTNVFGAGSLVYGTLVTSFGALILAAPIGIACGLFLSLTAPRRVAAVIAPLVEMLAAIPSVILGLWGILIVAPFLRSTIEPALHDTLGTFIPLFGEPSTTGLGLFNAIVILTIMVIPIIAAISRELFLNVPGDLKDAALALGATRWEMVRGVVLSSSRAGLVAACILGLSRALGEAIAVTQVIGGGAQSAIHTSLFMPSDTLASRIASQFPDSSPGLPVSSIFYLALILLGMELIANLAAQWVVQRYRREHGTA